MAIDKKFEKNMEHWWKRCMKYWYIKQHGTPEAVLPLTEKPRTHCGENDWDSYTEYGFLHGTGYTDEELEEIREDMRLRVTSPYDCSGQHFTMWLTFHRNPSGLISFTHRIGIDV